MPRIIDLTGQKFNDLTVICQSEKRKHGRIAWICQCRCGSKTVVTGNDLTRGHTTSCGCLLKKRITKHGKSRNNASASEKEKAAYAAWQQAKSRCYNPKNPRYPRYGGRGIAMFGEWRESFQAFYEYIGDKPSSSHSLDRINNDGNYEPGNVRWATREEQYRSRSTTIEIKVGPFSKSIKEISEITGIPVPVIRNRIFKNGWSVADAITKPLKKTKPRKSHPSQ